MSELFMHVLGKTWTPLGEDVTNCVITLNNAGNLNIRTSEGTVKSYTPDQALALARDITIAAEYAASVDKGLKELTRSLRSEYEDAPLTEWEKERGVTIAGHRALQIDDEENTGPYRSLQIDD